MMISRYNYICLNDNECVWLPVLLIYFSLTLSNELVTCSFCSVILVHSFLETIFTTISNKLMLCYNDVLSLKPDSTISLQVPTKKRKVSPPHTATSEEHIVQQNSSSIVEGVLPYDVLIFRTFACK